MDKKQKCVPAQDCYQTGSTRPPKNHGDVVTVLVVAVVVLAGVVGMLGIQNIQLFRALREQNLSSLTDGASTASTTMPTLSMSQGHPSLGIYGLTVSPVGQDFFEIPGGLYIVQVQGEAQRKGLRPGDILISLDGTAITTPAELEALLAQYQAGQQVTAVIYRDEAQMEVQMTVEVVG